MKILTGIAGLLFSLTAFAQAQTCPENINFSSGSLTHWWAYTGNNKNGNGPMAIQQVYDSTQGAPLGTVGVSNIQEYQQPAVTGIFVNTRGGTDPYGGFSIIPTLNGYAYNYSLILGSTAITSNSSTGPQGGYVRGVSYLINVPPGPPTQPYTMTYAYAMVLENGQHNSNQQPLFSATLSTHDSIISCASPRYFLPTSNNAGADGGGAVLDTAAALSAGFLPSSIASPNADPNGNGSGIHLFDVWTKDWTEVTFDLSAYRGQQVTLTFETDNCVPGGHFAYSYIAIRNDCAGLQISGSPIACTNSTLLYSVPALAGGVYSWSVPAGWTINSGSNTNIISTNVGSVGGQISVHEINSCADLHDTILVNTTPPTIAGSVVNDNRVCTGINSSMLTLTGNQGNVVEWLSSTNGITWNPVTDTTTIYNAQNLATTTQFRALVQNGSTCSKDSSVFATIKVDEKSVGGILSPSRTNICAGQNTGIELNVTGNTGNVVNWQLSHDSTNWSDFAPAYNGNQYTPQGVVSSIQYRLIIQNGVCPADTSLPAYLTYFSTPFPQASTHPADTTICYGDTATLFATITNGTNYVWENQYRLQGPASGIINSTPYFLNVQSSPLHTTDYPLSIQNAGCPNLLTDTFHVNVYPRIIVNAGRDTLIVANQPLQLQAISSDGQDDAFTWTPTTGLNNPAIADPIALLGVNIDTIQYRVRAVSAEGCYGDGYITVVVFKTGADIFVPTAFTPGSGINNIFKPIPVGISSLRYFRVFNRWGQLVYSTSTMGQGWDGRIAGVLQSTNTFVWMTQGITYTGRVIFKKGTVTLIR